MAEGILIDLDFEGAVVGFDIDHASKHLDLSTLETVAPAPAFDEDRLIPGQSARFILARLQMRT